MCARCPTCGKTFEVMDLAEAPSFPFCGERCKLVDLGRWLDGDYVVPEGTASSDAPIEDGVEEATEGDEA